MYRTFYITRNSPANFKMPSTSLARANAFPFLLLLKKKKKMRRSNTNNHRFSLPYIIIYKTAIL